MGTIVEIQDALVHQYSREQASQALAEQQTMQSLGGLTDTLSSETLFSINGVDPLQYWRGGITTDDVETTQFQPVKFGKQSSRSTIKFHRINEVIELAEGAQQYMEPLDELRMKVAKWLYN